MAHAWMTFVSDNIVTVVFTIALLGFLADRLTWARQRRKEADTVQATTILAGDDKCPRGLTSRHWSMLGGWLFMTVAVAATTSACYFFGVNMTSVIGTVSVVIGIIAVICSIALFCDSAN